MIHIIIGPPCSGKTSYVKTHRKADDIVVDFDALASAFGAENRHDSPPGIRALTHKIRAIAVDDIFNNPDLEAWIIYSYPPPAVLEKAKELGSEITVIDPGLNQCLANAIHDQRPAATEQWIRQWYENPPEIAKKGDFMKTKHLIASIKAVSEENINDEWTFQGYAAVFGNKDRDGDIIQKGAFKNSLEQYAANGTQIPCYWGHQVDDPMKNIGYVVLAEEDDTGLLVTVKIDSSTEIGKQVYKLLKEKRVTKMSFMYEIKDYELIDDCTFLLKELHIFEVSVVPCPANEQASVLAVKNASEKCDVKNLEERILAIEERLENLTASQDLSSNAESEKEDDSETEQTDTGQVEARGEEEKEKSVQAVIAAAKAALNS